MDRQVIAPCILKSAVNHTILAAIVYFFYAATPSVAFSQKSEPDIQYLFPIPASTRVPQETILLVRFDGFTPASLSNLQSFIDINGSESSAVSGKTRIASDEKTIQYRPDKPFVSGETVEVRLTPAVQVDSSVLDTTYSFQITEGVALKPKVSEEADANTIQRKRGSRSLGDPVVINGVSIPSDFPYMRATHSDNPAPGYVFLNNWGGQPYNMILDNTGAPVWYWRTPDRRRDFKLQPNGRLTMLVRQGYGGGQGFIALDDTYTVVDTMRAAAPYYTDEHELTVLPDGSYYLIAGRAEVVDMRKYIEGGQSGAVVAESVIQGFTADGELNFLWRAWDHFDITKNEIDDPLGAYIRFPHMNAIDVDEDGHILLSSRHLSEITKINKDTGEIIWRLGGYYGSFTFIDHPFEGFRSQHDIRSLGNNRYTLFDNGNTRDPKESRVVEYELDAVARTATRVWQFRHEPAWYTKWMANAQRLPNGNTLINYADASFPKILEIRPDGTVALEMDFIKPAHTYRTFKFEWQGKARVPFLVLENSSERITLLFNKFGDPDVDHYNIYGGESANPTALLASSNEPFLHLTELTNHTWTYFRVTAVSRTGTESDYSNERFAFVNRVEPGNSIVINGDFTAGLDNWAFETSGGAQATVSTSGDDLRFQITNGGSEIGDIHLVQSGIALTNGKEYRFEYDARSTDRRFFLATVTQDESPWTDYTRGAGWAQLSFTPNHVSYDFVMQDPSDSGARISLNAGDSSADVFVDNVSLKEIVTADAVVGDPENVSVYTLHQSYPNPFTGKTEIQFDLGTPQYVKLRIFNVLGREVKMLIDGWKSPGAHSVVFEANGLPSGTYFYKLVAVNANGRESRAVGRMVHIK